jgi:hypothetical protein
MGYKTNFSSNGIVERHKVRLVAKGFSQFEGIEYNEIFTPIDKMKSICLILTLVPSHK